MSTPLDAFFVQFANLGFAYKKKKTAQSNFKHLCKVSRWGQNSTAYSTVRAQYNIALVQEFNFIYGTANDLGAWQNLCSAIDITPIPDSIRKCKSHVWDAHVNIFDLLEAGRIGKPVRKFATLEELRAYTVESSKIFPKEEAYAGGLLKELLREIWNPYFGRRCNGSEKRKKRKAHKKAATMQLSS